MAAPGASKQGAVISAHPPTTRGMEARGPRKRAREYLRIHRREGWQIRGPRKSARDYLRIRRRREGWQPRRRPRGRWGRMRICVSGGAAVGPPGFNSCRNRSHPCRPPRGRWGRMRIWRSGGVAEGPPNFNSRRGRSHPCRSCKRRRITRRRRQGARRRLVRAQKPSCISGGWSVF